MAKTKDQLIDSVFKAEGGFSNDIDDNGNYTNGEKGKLAGEPFVGTNFGISAMELKNYLKRTPTIADMKALDKKTAKQIMTSNYYDKYQVDKVPSELQEIYFHSVFNSGGHGLKIMQEMIGMPSSDVDGFMGPTTLAYLDRFEKEGMPNQSSVLPFSSIEFKNKLLDKFKTFSTWNKHGKGWINRYHKLSGDTSPKQKFIEKGEEPSILPTDRFDIKPDQNFNERDKIGEILKSYQKFPDVPPEPPTVQESVPDMPQPPKETLNQQQIPKAMPSMPREVPAMPIAPTNFGEAFKLARAEHGGDGGLFKYKDKDYTTDILSANNGVSNVRKYEDGISDVPSRTKEELEAIISGPGNGWLFDSPEVNDAQKELRELNRRTALGGGPSGVPVPGSPTLIEVESNTAKDNLDNVQLTLKELQEAAQIELNETGELSEQTRKDLGLAEGIEFDAQNEREVLEVLKGNAEISEEKNYRDMYFRFKSYMENRGLTPPNYEDWKQRTDIKSGRIPPVPAPSIDEKDPRGKDQIPEIPEPKISEIDFEAIELDRKYQEQKIEERIKSTDDAIEEAKKFKAKDPSTFSKIEDMMKKYFGIEVTDITKAVGFYLASRATGASHAGSMQWAGKTALDGAQERNKLEAKTNAELAKTNAAAKVLLAAGYSPASVASWSATGIAGTLEKTGGASYTTKQLKDKYAELLGSKKYTLESLKIAFNTAPGDFLPGLLKLEKGNGKSNAENTSLLISSIDGEIKDMVDGVFEEEDSDKGAAFYSNMMRSAEEYWVSSGIPIGNEQVGASVKRVTSLAVQAALSDVKNGKVPSDLSTYIKNMSLSEFAQSGTDSVWKIGEKDTVPSNKIAVLREKMYNMSGGDTQVMKEAFIAKYDAFNNLDAAAKSRLIPSKGENKFYVYLRESLNENNNS